MRKALSGACLLATSVFLAIATKLDPENVQRCCLRVDRASGLGVRGGRVSGTVPLELSDMERSVAKAEES
jgi:hypothetical protein